MPGVRAGVPGVASTPAILDLMAGGRPAQQSLVMVMVVTTVVIVTAVMVMTAMVIVRTGVIILVLASIGRAQLSRRSARCRLSVGGIHDGLKNGFQRQ